MEGFVTLQGDMALLGTSTIRAFQIYGTYILMQMTTPNLTGGRLRRGPNLSLEVCHVSVPLPLWCL